MSTEKAGWIVAAIAIVIAIFLAAKNYQTDLIPPGQAEFPKQWKGKVKLGLLISNDANGTVFVVDGAGKELKSCKTCTPGRSRKYGEGCKDAPPEANICGPIKSVVPVENKSITILRAYGSDCWFVYPSGGELVGYPTGCTI